MRECNKVYTAHFRGEVIRTTKDKIITVLDARGHEAKLQGNHALAQDYFQHAEYWRNGDFMREK